MEKTPSTSKGTGAKVDENLPATAEEDQGGGLFNVTSLLGGASEAPSAPAEEDQGAGLFGFSSILTSDVAGTSEEVVGDRKDRKVTNKRESDADKMKQLASPPGCIVLPNYRQMWADAVFARAKAAVEQPNFDKQAVSRLSWGTLCRDREASDPWAVIDGRSLDKQIQWRLREGLSPPLGQHQDAGPAETRRGAVPHTPYEVLSKGIE